MNKRFGAVLEVVLFLGVLYVTAHLAVPVVKKAYGPVAGRLLIGFLWIVPAALYVLLFKKDKGAYGFDIARRWRPAVHFGFIGFVVMTVLQTPGFVLWGVLGLPGLLVLYALVMVSIVVLLRAQKAEAPSPRVGWKIVSAFVHGINAAAFEIYQDIF